ncbi:MAG: hypothetical protein FJ218_05525 [Ignavibacteria bacterium]|nr:hypothetical protein [Ignavibacteria bacterium]
MENTRKKILRIHGTLLIVMGVAMAINCTIGMMQGIGLYKFLQTDKMGHVGLYQAYLLAGLIGVVLWTGSFQERVRKWNRIGALFHALVLTVYVIHWSFFLTIDNGEFMRNSGVVFHLVFLSLESYAVFFK